MSIIDHIYLLERVHHHIEHKSTGTPREFAERLQISERKLYRILDELRDLGAIIAYNTDRSSYIYGNEVSININFRIDQFDKVRTKGGNFSKNIELLPFLAVKRPTIVVDSYWESPNPEMRSI
jgi:DNA-binding Lrp family transcriptional regulator